LAAALASVAILITHVSTSFALGYSGRMCEVGGAAPDLGEILMRITITSRLALNKDTLGRAFIDFLVRLAVALGHIVDLVSYTFTHQAKMRLVFS
jgi:hypothetical protein